VLYKFFTKSVPLNTTINLTEMHSVKTVPSVYVFKGIDWQGCHGASTRRREETVCQQHISVTPVI